MKNKNIVKSFENAAKGFIHAFKEERNLKIHVVSSIIIIFFSFYFKISKIEFAIILLTISSVIFAELINTAIENIVDMITDEYHPKAKVAKDVAAAAVFLTAFISVFVGLIVFLDRFANEFIRILGI